MSFRLAGGVSGVRSAIDALGNAYDDECQLEEHSHYENAHKETNNSTQKTEEPLRWGFLEAQDNVIDDINAPAENTDDVKNLHEAAHELLLKREVNETRKEVLFVRHVASWLNLMTSRAFS